MRALAQRSAEAAKEIKGLISSSSQHVQDGVELVADSGKALEQIEMKVAAIKTAIEDIAARAQEEATGLQQVNVAMKQMDQVTQQNAAMSEQANAASQSLEQECSHLTQLIAAFRRNESSAGATTADLRGALHKAAPHAFRERHAEPARNETPRLKRVAAAGGRRAPAREAEDDWQEF